jgi:hypothetical protein
MHLSQFADDFFSPRTQAAKSKAPAPSSESASAISNTLVNFVAGIGQQHKARVSCHMLFGTLLTEAVQDDVLNSMQLAEMAATHMYKRDTQLEQWYTKYNKVLSLVGWVTGDAP